jgi:hypothetical protein
MEAAYLLSHLRERLASEAGELAIEVALVDGCIRLAGVVTSDARRRELARIAESVSDGHEVMNEIHVVPPGPPSRRDLEQLS